MIAAQAYLASQQVPRKPELLILDEATSELDSDAEARIQAALEDIRGRTTVLVAAHRLSTITSADRIYVLEGGEIVELGPPGELLRRDSTYARLWKMQAAGFGQ